jgi:hypothetical protein
MVLKQENLRFMDPNLSLLLKQVWVWIQHGKKLHEFVIVAFTLFTNLYLYRITVTDSLGPFCDWIMDIQFLQTDSVRTLSKHILNLIQRKKDDTYFCLWKK